MTHSGRYHKTENANNLQISDEALGSAHLLEISLMAFRPKLWLTLGAALTLTAACSEQGQPGGESGGEGGGEGGAAAQGENEGGGGGESGAGEAGAAAGYAGVSADSLMALRIAHLKGFFMVAQRSQAVEGDLQAAALAGQGLAEVYDPSASAFSSTNIDAAVLRRAAETGSAADLAAAVTALDAAQTAAGGNAGEVVGALADISAGIYREVGVDGEVDPVEYQHALGAAMAAQATARAGGLPAQTVTDTEGLVAMWRGVTAPENVADLTPVGQVQAQASRIRLATAG